MCLLLIDEGVRSNKVKKIKVINCPMVDHVQKYSEKNDLLFCTLRSVF